MKNVIQKLLIFLFIQVDIVILKELHRFSQKNVLCMLRI